MSPTDTGTDPLVVDSDGDGLGDGVEVAAGSDPNVFASVPRSPAVPALTGFATAVLAGVLAVIGGLATKLGIGRPRRRD